MRLCNCEAIREALGSSPDEYRINGHEPDCVATNSKNVRIEVARNAGDDLDEFVDEALGSLDAASLARAIEIVEELRVLREFRENVECVARDVMDPSAQLALKDLIANTRTKRT